ncbi:MAG: DUF3089 domain-containing protein, partial [Acidobacteriia bacterium]|nr:DUF3089 domain-containing protein [Terriglobia bacterium]
ANLAGGSGELLSYFSTEGATITGTEPRQWLKHERKIDTPWVTLPGMLTGRCATNENATYLEVTVHADPGAPRTNDIIGDLGVGGQILANWGLHLVDMNIAMGNLLDIVGRQAKAFAGRAGK